MGGGRRDVGAPELAAVGGAVFAKKSVKDMALSPSISLVFLELEPEPAGLRAELRLAGGGLAGPGSWERKSRRDKPSSLFGAAVPGVRADTEPDGPGEVVAEEEAAAVLMLSELSLGGGNMGRRPGSGLAGS